MDLGVDFQKTGRVGCTRYQVPGAPLRGRLLTISSSSSSSSTGFDEMRILVTLWCDEAASSSSSSSSSSTVFDEDLMRILAFWTPPGRSDRLPKTPISSSKPIDEDDEDDEDDPPRGLL